MNIYLDKLLIDINLNMIKKNRITLCSNEDMKDNFHTQVSKFLYLSKRGLTDICLPVGYLTTTVSRPRNEDWDKIMRIFSYLKVTSDMR